MPDVRIVPEELRQHPISEEDDATTTETMSMSMPRSGFLPRLLRDNKMQEESVPSTSTSVVVVTSEIILQRQQHAKQLQQQDQVMSTLSGFFLGTEEEGQIGSPTSVFGFEKHQEQRKSYSEPSQLVYTAPSLNNSCPILHLKEQKHEDKVEDDSRQQLVKPFHRTNSMPQPRKSSMKKQLLGGAVSFNKNNESKRKSIKPSVSFHSISVREYNITMGDNPSCSYGVPIALGWEYQQHDAIPLSSTTNETPRNNNFGLSHHARRQLLKNAGYPSCAMRLCLRQVNRCKTERAMTELFLAAQPLEDAMEQLVRGVQHLMPF